MDKKKIMNKKNLGMLAIILLAIVLIFITIYSVNKENKKLAEQEPVTETVYVGFDDEKVLDNFTREDAVESLRALMIEIANEPETKETAKETEDKKSEEKKTDETSKKTKADETSKKIKAKETDETLKTDKSSEKKTEKATEKATEKTAKKETEKASEKTTDKTSKKETDEEDSIVSRLKKLDDEDTDIEDVLSKKAIDMLYFSEEFGSDKFNRQFAASSLLIYHELIRDAIDSDDFEPVINSFDQIVYLDNKFMNAHIPLDIFLGSGTGVAFEMQYVDGEWKLNPYTAMMSLNMMGIINENENEE